MRFTPSVVNELSNRANVNQPHKQTVIACERIQHLVTISQSSIHELYTYVPDAITPENWLWPVDSVAVWLCLSDHTEIMDRRWVAHLFAQKALSVSVHKHIDSHWREPKIYRPDIKLVA